MRKFSLCEPRFLDLSSSLLSHGDRNTDGLYLPHLPAGRALCPLLDLVSLLSRTLNPCLSSVKGTSLEGTRPRVCLQC